MAIADKMRALVAIVAVILAGCATDAPAGDAGSGQPAARAWPALDAALLRPGDKLRPDEVHTSMDALGLRGCTLNFVFTSPDGAEVFVGTASHCLAPSEGGAAPRVGDPWVLGGGVRATIAYCSWGAQAGTDECIGVEQDSPAHGNDLALLRIEKEDEGKVHPAVRHWGGPTGLAEPLPPGAGVRTYGNSYLRDGGAPAVDTHDAREGTVVDAQEWRTIARFTTPGVPGDSGSPVLSADGLAVGLVQSLQVFPGAGENAIVNLGPALAAMRELGGPDVVLATWPLV